MIDKSNIDKILSIFFDNPNTNYHLRELSRKLNISIPTIISATDKLEKEKLIIKKKERVVALVYANRENIDFLRKKRLYNLQKVYDSGIVEFLSKEYSHPKLIILFGSYSRGEDIENSDIDIAIVSNNKLNLDLEKYEKSLNKDINIHEINLNKISREFLFNLYNGIVLDGSW